MSGRMVRNVAIIGTGSDLPDRVLTNADLEKMVDTSDEWIRTRTGISERHIAGPEEAASDLAIQAARKAIEMAKIDSGEIQLVILTSATPDYFFPATGCLVQNGLGLKAGACDVLAGCSGFIYGLSIAHSMIAAGTVDTVLVASSSVLSRITDWEDRSTCVLLGDGAGAVILKASEEMGIYPYFDLGSDGSRGSLLIQPAGGSRQPATAETVAKRLHYLKMNGPEVFGFAVRIIPESSARVMKACGLEAADIDLVIPHQANVRIIEAAAKRMGIPWDKFYLILEEIGNTSDASIPIALDFAVRKGRITRRPDGSPSNILLTAFGAGLNWGSAVIRWLVDY